MYLMTGLPRAVTPLREMAVRVPSNHKNMLRNAQANVCPIMNNAGAGSYTAICDELES